MQKEFIHYEQALELKELGFDEPCFTYYYIDTKTIRTGLSIHIHNGWTYAGTKRMETVLAPTFSQAFRWFREKYGLEIILRPDTINAPEKKLREYVILSYDKSWVLEPIAEPYWWIRKGLFNTYEESELACLKKLIEIVKQHKTMTQHERADKLLSLREDLYEMHFHEVDRKWLIEAMVDFAQQLPQQEISDEEIEKFADEELGTIRTDFDFGVIQGMKWYREQLKQKK